MPTSPVFGSVAASVDEQFLDLLCSDEDLLRAEFDAIIAAEWPTPPTDDPAGDGVAGHHQRPGGTRGDTRVAAVPITPRHPGVGGWGRPRSPPNTGNE